MSIVVISTDPYLTLHSIKDDGNQIPGHRTIANFYLALLHAVGDKREKFGEPDPNIRGIDQSGPLTEILA